MQTLTIFHGSGHESVGCRADPFSVVGLDDDLISGELLERVQCHLGTDLVRGVAVVDILEASRFTNFPENNNNNNRGQSYQQYIAAAQTNICAGV